MESDLNGLFSGLNGLTCGLNGRTGGINGSIVGLIGVMEDPMFEERIEGCLKGG